MWLAVLMISACAGLIFFGLARAHVRPGFNAFAVGLCLAATPWFSRHLPLRAGDARDAVTVLLLLISATAGTALGGGLRPRTDPEHDQDVDAGGSHRP